MPNWLERFVLWLCQIDPDETVRIQRWPCHYGCSSKYRSAKALSRHLTHFHGEFILLLRRADVDPALLEQFKGHK